MIITCKQCGIVTRPINQTRKAKFCSRPCYTAWVIAHPEERVIPKARPKMSKEQVKQRQLDNPSIPTGNFPMFV